jgi:hypothetical protein
VEISMDAANNMTLAVDKKRANQSRRVRERNRPNRETNRSGFRRAIVSLRQSAIPSYFGAEYRQQ